MLELLLLGGLLLLLELLLDELLLLNGLLFDDKMLELLLLNELLLLELLLLGELFSFFIPILANTLLMSVKRPVNPAPLKNPEIFSSAESEL
jgi:hypothetical protein